MGCYYEHLTFVWFVAILRFADGAGTITWYEPPPVETTADTNSIRAYNTQLTKGSTNVPLVWNFSLAADLNLASVALALNTVAVVSIFPSLNNAEVNAGYEDRFNLSWINPVKATLIIFNVSGADEGEFACMLTTIGGGNKIWTRKIQVTVVDPASISHFSDNLTVNEGDNVTLNCIADGRPAPNITWIGASKNSSGSSFFFTITGKEDEGIYTCTANNGVGNSVSRTLFITVENYSPIDTDLSTNLTELTVTVGRSFNLICGAQANPPAKYRFNKEEERLFNSTAGSDLAVYTTSVSERIPQVTYSCTPFNNFGYGPTDTIIVMVHYSPEIDSPPSSETVVEGNGVILFCNATGNPQPNITWTKQGNNTVLSSIETLNLTNLRRGDNGAVYKCKVANNLNSAEATATITVSYPPTVTIQQCSTPVNESDNAMLYCNATGNPVPDIAWIKGGKVEYNKTLIISNISRDESGSYECLAWNDIGKNSSKSCTVDVQYPPKLTVKPLSQDVVEGNGVTLSCNATGNPQPNIAWTKQGNNTVLSTSETLLLTNLTRGDNGAVYKCKVQNNLGSDEATATITVLYPPSVTIQQCSTPVTEGNTTIMYCNATGKPVPNTAWIKPGKNVSHSKTLVIANISRGEAGSYECLAWNGIGSNDTKTCRVDVQYPPVIMKPQRREHTVNISKSITIECLADANPGALHVQYVWEKVAGGVVVSETNLTLNNARDSDEGDYICTATNILGSASFTIFVKVTWPEISAEMRLLLVNGKRIVHQAAYNDLTSAASKEITDTLGPLIKNMCTSITTYCTVEFTGLRNGSVIVSFILFFSPPVTSSEGLAKLRAAVNNGSIGPYTVTALKIVQRVEPTTTPSASPTSTATTEKTTTPNSDGPPWVVIGAVIGGVVVFAIIVAVVTWCVHKKRKCRRKGAKIHHSESEEQQAFSRQEGQLGADDNAYSQVNHGYAGTGPRSNGTETVALQQRAAADGSDAAAHQQEAAASPTYAEVDKSKKKKKKRDEEKPDYTYAEVDRSKKTKKKPKPGEMIYADLEDINVPRPMPTVSTSPQPLPPIKRPEPYENTQYADITQFLKGDATLPKDDGNQGTELQPQGANKDDGGAEGEDRNTPIQDVQFGIEGNTDAQVNNKYAVSGPTPANATDGAVRQQKPDANRHEEAPNQQAAAAPPTYTAVDKSKKKSKRKKEEEKSPGNSVVDKSQTKKQSDDTYAQVDKSKKSIKKQPNPDGVIYADLEGINMPRMPQVSTSPQPLPPLKRPTPYEGTEYADITEFRKGDVSPKTDDCADPEMQAQGTNKDGIGENNNETSF